MIVGLTGTNGAGKGTVAEILKNRGFVYHSCSDILRLELKNKGIEENIDNLIKIGNELREKFGAGVLGEKLLEVIHTNREELSIADSIRNPAEIEALKKDDEFILIAVDAPIKMRYERVQKRKRAGDEVSFEKFKEQEMQQLKGSEKQQQLIKCMEMSDFTIINEGNLDELQDKVEETLAKVK